MGGANFERELVNALTACNRPALRAPTSGSATDRDLPDVLCGTRVELESKTGPIGSWSDAWAIELKSTSGTTAYAGEAEVEALCQFAYSFGATPYIAGRFKRQGQRTPFYLVRPDDCRTTDGGRYGVPERDAERRAEWEVWPSTDTKDAVVEEVGGRD